MLTEALEFALLQNPQQFRLQFQGDFADLVEEYRAAIRQFEPPRHVARSRR